MKFSTGWLENLKNETNLNLIDSMVKVKNVIEWVIEKEVPKFQHNLSE